MKHSLLKVDSHSAHQVPIPTATLTYSVHWFQDTCQGTSFGASLLAQR